MCVSVLNKNQDMEEMGGMLKKQQQKNSLGIRLVEKTVNTYSLWKMKVENEFSPVMTFAIAPIPFVAAVCVAFCPF